MKRSEVFMSRWMKIGLVAGGYVAAWVGACAAVYINELMMPADISQNSGGMVAGGDMILFFFVVCFLSLAPTGLALYFLRSNQKFWNFFSFFSLVWAATGPLAEILNLFVEKLGLYHQPWWALASFLFMLRACGSVVFALGFVIFALLAPPRRARLLLLVAAGVEFAVFLFVAVRFVLWHRLI